MRQKALKVPGAVELYNKCGEDQEYVEHLFVTCGFAQTVCNLVSQWCKLPPIYAFQVRDLLDLHLYVDGSAKTKKVIQAICHMVFWCIWRCQNEAVLNQGQISMQEIMGDVKGLSFLLIKAHPKQLNLDWDIWGSFNVHRVRW
ncbi:uncharacterized protein LOC110885736 [Helianthus annuus]|uniref:uncharacterized protein LOC110885736 n=1 Tax=Helianthus annuus TaxID=4232 RepID=UPI001652F54F|nr:uncharacterized protein LOC110885736 [Helianthus annuus]